MTTLPLRVALLLTIAAPAASAQGVFAKALEKAHKVADQESYGGEVSFPDGIARFYDLSLTEVAAANPPPTFVSSPGFVKLADGLRAAGKPETADALMAKLTQLLIEALPSAAQAVREAAAASAAVTPVGVSELRGGRNLLVDSLRKASEPKIKETLRPIVKAAADQAGLMAAFDAFVAASGAKLPDSAAALTALEDQVVGQAVEVVFAYLAKQERIYRAYPERAPDKFVTAAFNMLKLK